MNTADPGFRPQLRLHRLSWLFALTASVRQLIVPLVAAVVFGARDDASSAAAMLFPLVLAALLVRAVWRQWIYRYGFGPRGLVIQEGLIFRNVRQIEYPRIENIDTERGLLHRLLGVADVSVQTSTGGKPEALVSVLDLDAVREMRERIFADVHRASQAAAASAPQQTEQPLLHLAIPELVRFGLIDNRGMIVVAAASGLLYELGLFDVDRALVEAWLRSSSTSWIAALGPVIQAALALSAVVGALLALRLLSVALAVVTLFDFTLVRRDGDLRAQYGLLTRVALTLRTSRIQAIHQTRTLPHRWFDRASLNVDLTGDRGGEEQRRQGARSRMRWLAPICSPDTARELIAAAAPEVDWSAQPQWRQLAPGARTRIFRRALVSWVLVTIIPAVWWFGAGALIVALAGAPMAWVHAHLYVKHTAWALGRDVVLYRRGWLTRRLTIAPRDRVQCVSMHSSPFDRRWRMASVFVDTAGGSAITGEIRIRYLDASTATALTADLYRGRTSAEAASFASDAAPG